MKTTLEIARECNVTVEFIRQLVHRHSIKGVKPKQIGFKTFYNKAQEQKIHQLLFEKGKTEYLILESKMNYDVS
jgi:hypothetical protein